MIKKFGICSLSTRDTKTGVHRFLYILSPPDGNWMLHRYCITIKTVRHLTHFEIDLYKYQFDLTNV